MTSQSRTRNLYQWLEDQGYLWMLETPYDERLSAFTGAAPAVRMWQWKRRDGVGEPNRDCPPSRPSDIDQAFDVVEGHIRRHFS